MLIADRSGIISDHFDPRVIGVNVSFRWFWPCYVAVPSIVKRCCVIHRNCLVPAYHLRPTPDIRMYPQYLGGRWTVGNMWNGFWSRSAHNQRWEFPSSHRQFPILLCKFLQLKWLYLSPSPPAFSLSRFKSLIQIPQMKQSFTALQKANGFYFENFNCSNSHLFFLCSFFRSKCVISWILILLARHTHTHTQTHFQFEVRVSGIFSLRKR